MRRRTGVLTGNIHVRPTCGVTGFVRVARTHGNRRRPGGLVADGSGSRAGFKARCIWPDKISGPRRVSLLAGGTTAATPCFSFSRGKENWSIKLHSSKPICTPYTLVGQSTHKRREPVDGPVAISLINGVQWLIPARIHSLPS